MLNSSCPQTSLGRIHKKQVYQQVCGSGKEFKAKDTYLVNRYSTFMEVNEIGLESTETEIKERREQRKEL